ncbi:hypothetical protein Ahy_A09g046130 [Arachis hypogaea]|uniref:Ubiquitin-like protease family profile domain-containing protein n=1 Tax=Arachis hypogaea TaxID=3818 RepID=A0A445BP09_ARAHY|nr:hypothetical protein Ahy_A09g046130 [Arachis hypogaea]
MMTESDRMEFRRYFILVVMKIFLCPTTQQVHSLWHIYPVLDVSDPRRFNWPLEILKWFDTTFEKYKLKGNKTYTLFSASTIRCLDNCLEHEPWLDAWTSERLEKKVQYILSEGRLLTRHGGGDDINGRSPQAARRKSGKKNHRSVGKSNRCCQGGGQSVERVSRFQMKDDQGDVHHLHLQQREVHAAISLKLVELLVVIPISCRTETPRVNYFEQLQNTSPLQAVMPANPSCMTPSPPGKQISLGNAGTEQKYTQCTPIKIVQWMCSTFNDLESLQFKDDFYCIPPRILETVLQKRNLASFREDPTVSYMGLGPHFGDDSIFFDKIAASMQKWKRLWVLDSMNTGVPNNERVKLHAYAARLIEDMAKFSMPAYEHTENGLPRFYASIPQQDNGCDCGVFVINFMQFWGLDKLLQHWDQDVVQEFRKEIVLDIVMDPHNLEIGKALQALESNHVHRNQPRKKYKAMKSPFTAPSTKSMLQRAGLPTRKPRKGGRQRK